MSKEAEESMECADFGLITPVSLPTDGRIPDTVTGAASPAEYDGYFRITRDAGDLIKWTDTCLKATEGLLDDLPSGGLDDAERSDLLRGLVLVLQSTLSRWLAAHIPSASH